MSTLPLPIDADLDEEHPAARYEGRVRDAGGRAKLAMGALAATMVVTLADIGARAWSIALLTPSGDGEGGAISDELLARLATADTMVNASLYAHWAVLVVTATLYLRWLRATVALAHTIGSGFLAWTPSTAAWSFFIPVVSLFRPYQVLRDLHTNLDPNEIREPPVKAARDAAHDYRSVHFVAPPAAKAVSNAQLGLWWGTYLASSVGQRLVASGGNEAASMAAVVSSYKGQIFVDGLHLVAAALAIQVVHRVTQRLDERYRRLRHTSAESLAQQQIIVR